MRISDWSSDVCSSDLIGLLANHVERDLLRVIVTLIETRVEQRRGLARQIFERRSAAIGSRDQSGHRYVFKPERSVQRGHDRSQRDVETIWRGYDVAFAVVRECLRAEELRVGKEGVRPFRSRWS